MCSAVQLPCFKHSSSSSSVVLVRYYVVIAVPEYTIFLSVLMCQSRRGVHNPEKKQAIEKCIYYSSRVELLAVSLIKLSHSSFYPFFTAQIVYYIGNVFKSYTNSNALPNFLYFSFYLHSIKIPQHAQKSNTATESHRTSYTCFIYILTCGLVDLWCTIRCHSRVCIKKKQACVFSSFLLHTAGVCTL